MVDKKLIIYEEQVKSLIHEIRGVKIILDYNLAQLYGVETAQLKRQVRRNIARFPQDFMFELSKEEYEALRRQFGTLEKGRGKHSKYLPYAFTEQGVAMLSGVLRSDRAIEVNISIMRAFVQMRQISFKYEEIMATLEDIQERINLHEGKLDILELFMKQHMIGDLKKNKNH